MPRLPTRPFDPAAHVNTPEAVLAYLESAFETGDAAAITDAIGVVARSAGMSEIARRTGRGRESLYRALRSDGNPSLSTVISVVSALGLRLAVQPRDRA